MSMRDATALLDEFFKAVFQQSDSKQLLRLHVLQCSGIGLWTVAARLED